MKEVLENINGDRIELDLLFHYSKVGHGSYRVYCNVEVNGYRHTIITTTWDLPFIKSLEELNFEQTQKAFYNKFNLDEDYKAIYYESIK
jgi:hypothetical protein